MSLKIAVATLLVVALLECGAFRLNMPRTDDEDYALKDFTYESSTVAEGRVSVTGTQPGVTAYPKMENISSWQLVTKPDSKAIMATIRFPHVHVTYFHATAIYGHLEDRGSFDAFLDQQLYNLTLTATKIDKCEIEVKVTARNVRPQIDMSNLGDAGSFFEQKPFVEEIEPKLGKILGKALINILTDNVQFVSRRFRAINQTALCQEILESDAAHCPQPDIWG